MNSGIRFSVALIVVVVVLLGLYYAGLDDGQPRGEEADTTPVQVAIAPPTETEPVVAEPVIRESPSTDPSTDSSESSASTRYTDFDEFPGEVEPAETEELAIDPVIVDPIDLVAEEVEIVEDPDGPGVGSADSIETELVEEPASDSEEELAVEEDSTPADEEIDRTPPAAVDTSAVIDRGMGADEARSPLSGRSASAPGVGLHRLASMTSEGDLATAATRALSEASSPGIVAGPDNTAWLPLASPVAPALLEDAFVGRVPGHDTPHVLVVTDRAGTVDLAGRISMTAVVGSDQTGAWQVRFRVKEEAMQPVRIATRSLIGKPVAWVAGGQILVINRPLIAVDGKGQVPATFGSESEADQVAEILATSRAERMESGGGAALESTTGSRRPDAEFVVVGAGSLPLDQYVEYVVKRNDNFESIALWWFGDRSKSSLIAEANPLEESSRLQIGQTLRLPPKDMEFTIAGPRLNPATGMKTYRVRSGDTLGKIAQRAYGKASEYHRIHEANKTLIGEDPGNLKVGMELVIP